MNINQFGNNESKFCVFKPIIIVQLTSPNYSGYDLGKIDFIDVSYHSINYQEMKIWNFRHNY